MTTTERHRLESIRNVLTKWLAGDIPKGTRYPDHQQRLDRELLNQINKKLCNASPSGSTLEN